MLDCLEKSEFFDIFNFLVIWEKSSEFQKIVLISSARFTSNKQKQHM